MPGLALDACCVAALLRAVEARLQAQATANVVSVYLGNSMYCAGACEVLLFYVYGRSIAGVPYANEQELNIDEPCSQISQPTASATQSAAPTTVASAHSILSELPPGQ